MSGCPPTLSRRNASRARCLRFCNRLRIITAAAIEARKTAPIDPAIMIKFSSETPIIDASGFDAAVVGVDDVADVSVDPCCETGTKQDGDAVDVTTCVCVNIKVVACVSVKVTVDEPISTEQSFCVVTKCDACDRDLPLGHAKQLTMGLPKYNTEQKQAVPFEDALVPQFEQTPLPVVFL